MRWVAVVALAFLLPGSGCGRDPKAEAEREARIVEELALAERYDDALPHAQRMLRLREAAYGPGHASVASTLGVLGSIHLRLGHLVVADSLLRRALELTEVRLAGGSITAATFADPAEYLSVLDRLAECAERLGHPDEAEGYFRRVLRLSERAWGRDDPLVGMALVNHGRCLTVIGRHDEADSTLGRAVAIAGSTPGMESASMGIALGELASLRRAQGRGAEAAALEERARAIERRESRTPADFTGPH